MALVSSRIGSFKSQRLHSWPWSTQIRTNWYLLDPMWLFSSMDTHWPRSYLHWPECYCIEQWLGIVFAMTKSSYISFYPHYQISSYIVNTWWASSCIPCETSYLLGLIEACQCHLSSFSGILWIYCWIPYFWKAVLCLSHLGWLCRVDPSSLQRVDHRECWNRSYYRIFRFSWSFYLSCYTY